MRRDGLYRHGSGDEGRLVDRLKNKVTVVTGAARGIGEAIARAFIAEGAHVCPTDIDRERGRALAESLGGQARFEPLDVREEGDWRRVVAGILARHGRLDVLVNNAGITGFEAGMAAHDPEHATLEDWRAVHATNLDGTFLGCKHARSEERRVGKEGVSTFRSRGAPNH